MMGHSPAWPWKNKQCRNSMAFGFLAQVLTHLRLLSFQSWLVVSWRFLLLPIRSIYILSQFSKTNEQTATKTHTHKKKQPKQNKKHFLPKQKPICKFAGANLFANHKKTLCTPHSICQGVGRCVLSSVVTWLQTTHTQRWSSCLAGHGLTREPNSNFCFSS